MAAALAWRVEHCDPHVSSAIHRVLPWRTTGGMDAQHGSLRYRYRQRAQFSPTRLNQTRTLRQLPTL
ncbi:MAG: hypothetical protein M0Z36_11570 [Thermaerobacter sp.]|nr:hypothetical protein [Thermaerobacter sp.]